MGIKTIEVQEAEKHLKELVSLVVTGEPSCPFGAQRSMKIAPQ